MEQYGIQSQGRLSVHDHSTILLGGNVPLASITNHNKAVHDALHLDLGSLTVNRCARAWQNTPQTLIHNVRAKLLFNNTTFNVGGNFRADGVNSDYIVPANEGGFYFINAQSGLTAPAFADCPIELRIELNGDYEVTEAIAGSAAWLEVTLQASGFMELVPTDVIEIWMYQSGGGPEDIILGRRKTWVEIIKLGV